MPAIAGGDRQRIKSGLDAFISYSRLDSQVVLPFVRRAEQLGRSIWFDADDIAPGAPWRAELGTAIEAADAMVCCLSPGWLASTECRREYDRAVELGKRLVPVLVRDVTDVPEELTALQWVDARAGAAAAEVATAILAAVDTDHERVREHTHWLSRALRWQDKGQDPSLLLRGQDLLAAEDWLTRSGVPPSPTPLHVDFVAASRRGERHRQRSLLTAATTAVVVALALAGAALVQRNEAVHERDQAQSRAFASAAVSQLDVDPERSLLLARLAYATSPTDQALGALRAAVDTSAVRVAIGGHKSEVSDLVWTADGRIVVSAGRDGRIGAWDPVNGTKHGQAQVPGGAVRLRASTSGRVGLAITEGGGAARWTVDQATGTVQLGAQLATSGVRDGAVSGDGTVIVTGFGDGSVRRWAPADPQGQTTDPGPAGPIQSLALASDGRLLLVGGEHGAAYIGPLGRRPTRIATYATAVSTAQLSADGAVALTASDDGEGSVRRSADGSLILALHDVFVARLDSTGARVVTGDVSGRVLLHDLSTGAVTDLAGRGSPVRDLQFASNGSAVVAAGTDGVARVWRVKDGSPVAVLRGSSGPMSRAIFSPDQHRVLTGNSNGTVRVWALPGEPLPLRVQLAGGQAGIDNQVTSASYTPDGSAVLTTSRDGLARAWNARTGKELPLGRGCVHPPLEPACLAVKTFDAQGPWLTRARYSRDGRLLATSSQNGSAVIWDARSAGEISRLIDVGGPIDDIAFSLDGKRLLAATRDGGARLIEVATGRGVADLKGSDRAVNSVAVTSDGAWLTADDGGVIRSWDPAGRSGVPWSSVQAGVLAMAVQPRGGSVAVATADKVVLLDPTGKILASLAGHTGLVTAVTFSPDGRLLISGGLDGTVRVWDVRSLDQAAVFRVPGGGVNSVDTDHTGHNIVAATPASAAYIVGCDICTDEASLVRLASRRVTRQLDSQELQRFVVR